MATPPGGQWRGFRCDNTYQCTAVPCCSLLSGWWPRAGLVLGNESSDISSLLLEQACHWFQGPVDARLLPLHCGSASLGLLSICSLRRRKAPHPFAGSFSIILPLPNLFLRPYLFPTPEGPLSHISQVPVWHLQLLPLLIAFLQRRELRTTVLGLDSQPLATCLT